MFPPHDHDHARCATSAVARARETCAATGVKLTPLRERVLVCLAESHAPLGAYDIIERLATDSRRLAPISVYRVLDVLAGAGLIHRLESRNAFFACRAPHAHDGRPLVMLCEVCDRVAESASGEMLGAVSRAAEAEHFATSDAVLELRGTCGPCRMADTLAKKD